VDKVIQKITPIEGKEGNSKDNHALKALWVVVFSEKCCLQGGNRERNLCGGREGRTQTEKKTKSEERTKTARGGEVRTGNSMNGG